MIEGFFLECLKEWTFKTYVFYLQKNMSGLHFVARRGFDREAGLLLEAGVDINAVDNVSMMYDKSLNSDIVTTL